MLSFLVRLWLYRPTFNSYYQIASINLGVFISCLFLICNFCFIVWPDISFFSPRFISNLS